MKKKLQKELINYYIEKEKIKNSNNSKDKIRIKVINTIIKRIKLILKLSKYININKLVKYENKLINKNLSKNLDNIDKLCILKWLEYSKFLARITNKNINYS